MSPVWDADVDLSMDGAARLIEAQFPSLAPARLEPFGVGWDNAAYLVNGKHVFRFPRRKMGADLIAREIRALPLIAPHVPLPIPIPRYVGAPTDEYPYPFAGYAVILGITACRLSWTDRQRARLAAPLGQLLRALHSIPVDDTTRVWAPVDDIERANRAKRAPRLKELAAPIVPQADGVDVEQVCDLLDELTTAPSWAGPTCWVHGDLYARHLLVNVHDVLSGIIDWGDVHLGDPALDISIAWSFLPAASRGEFRDAYGAIDEATWDRARFRALHYGVLLLDYGAQVGDDAIWGVGEYALTAALIDK